MKIMIKIKNFIPARQFKHNPNRFNVMSSGMGTQSNAIICMIHAEILPKPDVIVAADTEREASNVFEYQKKHIQPLCDEMNIPYYIVPKSQFTNVDLVQPSSGMTLAGYYSEWDGRKENGECRGKQPGYCSARWKREVIERFLNKKYGQSYLTKRGVDMWMGMSLDEPKRIKVTTGKWHRVYPLFEMMITRQMAIQFVEQYNLPTPPRSACWMCPNRRESEWLWMKENVPEDFKKACEHEKEIQKDNPHLWLTKYGVPLADAPLKSNGMDEQLDLVQFCDSGMCFV